MPKDKLEIVNKDELQRLPVAAQIAGVTLGDQFPAGGTVHQEIKFKTASQLYRMGRLIDKITPAEIKAFEERKAAKIKK